MSEPENNTPPPAPSAGRLLPFSVDSERALVSCLLQDPARIAECNAVVPTAAFYDYIARTVLAELVEMDMEAVPIDTLTVSRRLSNKGLLDRIGGNAAVMEIHTFVALASHYGYHLKVVRNKWLVRQGITACAENMNRLYDHGKESPEEEAATVMSECEARFFSVLTDAQTGTGTGGPKLLGAYIPDWVTHIEESEANVGKTPKGITTGLLDVDRCFHGLDDTEGELVAIAARPSMGKTAMMNTIVEHVALERGIPCAVFSIEMGANQILDRCILGRAGVDTSKATSGMFSRGDKLAIPRPMKEWQGGPVHADFSSYITTAELRSRCQVLKRQHGIRAVFIDHLDHISGVSRAAQDDERLRIVEAMNTLHWIRRELKLVVFILVQLNEASEKNPGRLPVLSDLHGSGHIGRLCTQVIFIQRPVYYKPWGKLAEEFQNKWRDKCAWYAQHTPENWAGETEYDEEEGGLARQHWEEHALAIVRKNRRGPTPDNIALWFRKNLAKFANRTAEMNSSNPARRQVVLPAV